MVDIYDRELIVRIREELDEIEVCDDGGGIAFGYQRILDLLHDCCDEVVGGKPSITNEYGGI